MREPPGPLWGRAASCCLLPRQISGRRAACPVGRAAVCAGGRRPAREIATREPDGSEWSISRPALALPPPTGTAAWPSGTLQSVGVPVRCPPRLRHRPRAPQPGPPAPSAPVGPGVLMRIHIIAEPTPNFACNSLLTIFNFEFISLELQRFWALLKVQAIELHAKFGEGCVAGVRWGVGA